MNTFKFCYILCSTLVLTKATTKYRQYKKTKVSSFDPLQTTTIPKSLTECCTVCMNQDSCNGVQYDGKSCITITNAKLTFPTFGWENHLTTDMMESVQATALIGTCDYTEKDILGEADNVVFRNVESVFECQLLCKGHAQCEAFVHVSNDLPNGARAKDCYLKWGAGLYEVYAHPGLTAGFTANC